MASKVVGDVIQALARAKRDLVKEAQRISAEIEKIDAFISGRVKSVRRRVSAVTGSKPKAKGKRGGKRRISAEGRARIAAAQRKRWAKVRASKKGSKASAKA
jgi:hypothetical protein